MPRDEIQCPAVFRIPLYNRPQFENQITNSDWIIPGIATAFKDVRHGKIIPKTPPVIKDITQRDQRNQRNSRYQPHRSKPACAVAGVGHIFGFDIGNIREDVALQLRFQTQKLGLIEHPLFQIALKFFHALLKNKQVDGIPIRQPNRFGCRVLAI